MRSPLVTVTLTAAAILAVLGGFAIVVEQSGNEIAQVRGEVGALERSVANLEVKLDILLEGNESLAEKLATEEERRAALEEQQESLLSDVTSQFSTLKSEEATAIVARWEPYVYDLACIFPGDEDEPEGGSATVERVGSVTRFVTNEHVLEKKSMRPITCTLSKPDKKEVSVSVNESALSYETDVDIAYGTLPSGALPALGPEKRCSAVPAIGDRVVILGYPSIGATDSITATEGIISGFGDEYYITSAKIEKGNSGGAAIHVKNDCLLGLPTLVVAGRIESLARILPLK